MYTYLIKQGQDCGIVTLPCLVVVWQHFTFCLYILIYQWGTGADVVIQSLQHMYRLLTNYEGLMVFTVLHKCLRKLHRRPKGDN